jgi:hypothetical protein
MNPLNRLSSCALSVLACVVAAAAGLLAGCGGGAGTSTGTANVLLTDSPSCGYDHVYVTVDHVEISPDGSSWTSIPVSASLGRIDLLSLNNGTLISLGQTPLTAGTYQQVRLVLAANGNAAPYANSVVLAGSATEIALTTPSGQQSGYKIVGPFTIAAGAMADLVLDFNACKSIVVAGASGKYLLKPVVSAVAELVAGKIIGTTVAGSHVYAEQQSTSGPVVVTGTAADASTGAFTLWPLQQSTAAGPVDVVIVPPPPSSVYTLSGVITVTAAAGAADLVVEQTVSSSGRTYEIASASTTSGPYSIPLASAGPWLGTYSTTLPLVFAQDMAASDVGIYDVTATDAAGSSASHLANVRTGPAVVDFFLSP